MKQTSNTPSNDILNRLRENVENQAELSNEEVKPSKSPMSHEQLLEQLRRQMGDSSTANATDTPSEDDYDISGFEIENTADNDPSAEEETIEQPESSTEELAFSENAGDQNQDAIDEEQEDSVPWETKEEESVAEYEETQERNESLVISQDADAEADREEQDGDEDEFDESLAEEDFPEEQEALKRQIARFVEKTVEPDEVFDYFEGLDKKAAKARENFEEVEAVDHNVAEYAPLPEERDVEIASDPLTDESQVATDAITAIEETVVDTAELVVSEPVSPAVEQFFFGELSDQNVPNTTQTGIGAAAMDDTDINLLLALGKKQALEEAVGFVRVREAKNNFYDPTDEESFGNHVFAYDGEEFRDASQVGEIKTRYRKEKKTLWRRLFGTVCLALLALVVEYLPIATVEIPFVSEFLRVGVNYQLTSLILVFFGILLSIKPLLDGARGFLVMRPNRFTPLAVIAFANVAYSSSVLLFFRGGDAGLFNFAILVFLAVSVVGDVIRLNKEMMTFDIVADPKEKFALEKADPSPEISREEKILLKRDLLVEKVSFVGKYFTRTAKRSTSYAEYFVELLATLIAASFVAIGVAAAQKELLTSMNAFMLVLIVCMPMQHLIGSYPFGRLAKILYRHDSAVIGEAVDREYVGANTVYLDDIEVFGHHGVSVSGLRTYNDANFYDVLYHAFAVFSRMEGPLRYVLESSSREIEMAEEAEILKIHENGIEALVDGTTTVLIGNGEFMKRKHFPAKQTEDDTQKIENGETSILYMVVDDVLCAKFYMKYTITKRFETFVNEMHENNTKVGIRTLDPNVSEEMLSLLRKDKEITLSVIRPTLNDLVPVGRRSDSSIITAKNSHMIARILALCGRVKRVNRVCAILRICSMLVAFLAVVAFVFAKWLALIPSVAIVIYQLLWFIPSGIYTAAKLK